jgi:hypothetical protein
VPPRTQAQYSLLPVFNGVLAHSNVTNAQRVAGVTTYRGFLLTCQSIYGAGNVSLWMPPQAGAQALYYLGTETPVSGSIQTIPNEFTAPSGVTFTRPTTSGAPLVIGSLVVNQSVGIWLKRVFPASGTMDIQENFQLSTSFLGGG